MQYVVQMEEVDISDGCEAVNVWDLDCSDSLARARELAKGIIRSIKDHALPQLSEISNPTNSVSVSKVLRRSSVCTDRKYHSHHGKRIQVCLWTVVELWKTNRKGIIT